MDKTLANMEKRFITTQEACRTLGVGIGWVYNLLQSGKLEAVKEDGRWKINIISILERKKILTKQEAKLVRKNGG